MTPVPTRWVVLGTPFPVTCIGLLPVDERIGDVPDIRRRVLSASGCCGVALLPAEPIDVTEPLEEALRVGVPCSCLSFEEANGDEYRGTDLAIGGCCTPLPNDVKLPLLPTLILLEALPGLEGVPCVAERMRGFVPARFGAGLPCLQDNKRVTEKMLICVISICNYL